MELSKRVIFHQTGANLVGIVILMGLNRRLAMLQQRLNKKKRSEPIKMVRSRFTQWGVNLLL